ncbi:hypothetical protein AKJ51_04055 [candidate division MSBL1 archaeon SCGC-AAA382A20]|uniref:Uncharacterized protein n=1 Tax=candidate division MSBL1 archaeon SCGC-AAA382A20 TaxID=1698280 RepID=A0A133VIB4_9EURY|nr:hypothetical protein AKJ51_04055 [candidate division MSBL1 archaeon SCGC-AAA382A20]
MQRELPRAEKNWVGRTVDMLVKEESKVVLNLEKTKTSISLTNEKGQSSVEIKPEPEGKLEITTNNSSRVLEKEKFLENLRKEITKRLKLKLEKTAGENKSILAALLQLRSLLSNTKPVKND